MAALWWFPSPDPLMAFSPIVIFTLACPRLPFLAASSASASPAVLVSSFELDEVAFWFLPIPSDSF